MLRFFERVNYLYSAPVVSVCLCVAYRDEEVFFWRRYQRQQMRLSGRHTIDCGRTRAATVSPRVSDSPPSQVNQHPYTHIHKYVRGVRLLRGLSEIESNRHHTTVPFHTRLCAQSEFIRRTMQTDVQLRVDSHNTDTKSVAARLQATICRAPACAPTTTTTTTS